MNAYYDCGHLTIYDADDLSTDDLGHATCVVTFPPYNLGVPYDRWDDSLADYGYHHLTVRESKLLGDLLVRRAGRAWVNVEVFRLHIRLDALQYAGLAERHVVSWDDEIAPTDTARRSSQSHAAPHPRHDWKASVVGFATDWKRGLLPGIASQWRHRLGNLALLCREIWRLQPGVSTNSAHPAVVPVELATRAICLPAWPREVVVGPFCECETAMLAARDLERSAIAVEISECHRKLTVPLAQGASDVVG